MALYSCISSSQLCVSLGIEPRPSNSCSNLIRRKYTSPLKSNDTKFFRQPAVNEELSQLISSNFLRGSRTLHRPSHVRNTSRRRSSAIYALWLPSSEIANSAFTLGTAAVLPFYAFMVVAPQAEFTKKVVSSSIPFVALGLVYAYLFYLSWTPDTLRILFASKYWLPELPGIAKMFTSEMTLASAWIHLLAVDLFAARQVYFDGLHKNIETRHSVFLCLLVCPVGILIHFITKAVSNRR